MRKLRFLMLAIFASMMATANAQCEVYTLIKPDCATLSFGLGGLINNKVGDADFCESYTTLDFQIGKYFNKNFGITGEFSYNSEGDNHYGTRIYTIGALINSRLTNYYADSPIDLVFNLGLAYGRFDFREYIDSEGMNYIVPKVSLDIAFNITNDKAMQFVVEPSYQYFIATQDKYYYDNGDKVNANISAFGIKAKLRFNF
jgi:hypothetical protein